MLNGTLANSLAADEPVFNVIVRSTGGTTLDRPDRPEQ